MIIPTDFIHVEHQVEVSTHQAGKENEVPALIWVNRNQNLGTCFLCGFKYAWNMFIENEAFPNYISFLFLLTMKAHVLILCFCMHEFPWHAQINSVFWKWRSFVSVRRKRNMCDDQGKWVKCQRFWVFDTTFWQVKNATFWLKPH